jgi:methionine synthase I (cobalamin-dependent)
VDDIDDWTIRMATLHRQWGLKILGGCCGTGLEHLQRLVAEILCPVSKAKT